MAASYPRPFPFLFREGPNCNVSGAEPPSCGSAIVGPMQERLALARATHGMAGLAMPSDLRGVSLHSLPAPDLPRILLGHAPAHITAAILLEPAARIVRINPILFAPFR
jgi:hypothetical protein